MTIAASRIPLYAPRAPHRLAGGFVDRAIGPLVGLLGFLSFMPYPSISIGNATAVQMGNVLTVLLLLVCGLTIPWRQKSALLYPLILLPMLLSAVKAAWSGGGDMDLCFKAIVGWCLTCLTLVAVVIFAPRYGLQLLIGIAVATLIHTAVGFLQAYSFSNGEFPLFGLYVNQSFSSVQESALSIAKYSQRPFGIFPEPSAMSSSLAPFILLWVAEACGIVRFRQQLARWQRMLFLSASAGGLALIILSRSGHAATTLAALVMFGLIWLFKAKATRQTFRVVAIVFGLILPLVVWWGAMTMTDRIGGELRTPNGSWDDRSSSLIIGYSVFAQGDPATILFGLGVGLGANAVYHASGIGSIWSVLLVYVYETGLVGTAVLVWIGTLLCRIWHDSRFNVAFLTIALVWLIGITVITSYGQLLPIWVAFGWLVVWPSVCVSESDGPERELVAPAEPLKLHRNPSWTDPLLQTSGADVSPGDSNPLRPKG